MSSAGPEGNDVLVNDKYNRFTSIQVARFIDLRAPGGRDNARQMFGDPLDSDGWIDNAKVLARIGT